MFRLRGWKDALPEMKRKIAESITSVLIEDGQGKTRKYSRSRFHDVPATNYAGAGVTGGGSKADTIAKDQLQDFLLGPGDRR